LESIIPDKVIYVNNQHPHADDSNRGIQESPMKTIGAAAHIAMLNHQRGFSTKVIVYPGTYREQIEMNFPYGKASPLIMFEAQEPGTVIVSGSDVWKDWEKVGETNVYVHRWPHKWGFMSGPSQLKQKYGPIVRRREMIFVDNNPVEQVLSLEDLKKGTFYISEEESRVYLNPVSGVPMTEAMVEVAIRANLLEVNNANGIILRGLTFQHDTTGLSTLSAAVYLANSTNLLIEDCRFMWNNWFGLRFSNVKNVTTRRNTASYNGGAGWEAWKVKNLVSEEDETSYNNWRGVRGNFLGWEIAGAKHHNMHDAVYQRFKAIANHTRGLWLDYDNSNVLIEEGYICENLMDGVNLEASEGPINIRKNRISNNKGHGITSDSSKVTLEENNIYGNALSQVKHAFGNDRPVKNWETGEELKIHGNDFALKRNVIATDSNAPLLELPKGDQLLSSLALDGNRWYHANRNALFRVGKRSMSFSEWKEVTGRGDREIHADPKELEMGSSMKNCK
jgi:parallel beta-helix repeat protein